MQHFNVISQRLLPLILLSLTSLLIGQNRSIDGTNNNLAYPEWGAVSTPQLTVTSLSFLDGMGSPAGHDRPNPRYISNEIFEQEGLIMDQNNLSDFAWVWGQFIDHDITLVGENHQEAYNIAIPMGDPYFDPNSTGQMEIPFARSVYKEGTGTSIFNPRVFPNDITAFIDGSGVYGSTETRAKWLRSFVDGKMKTSSGNLLPYNTINGEEDGEIDENAPGMAMAGNPHATNWFIAGDVRANENVLLLSMHTLFVREHNRLCDILKAQHAAWTDEMLYQRARKMVGAMIQRIVYEEWLPSLGIELPQYVGYYAHINPGIMNVFSAAAYRYGHTVISSDILRLDAKGNMIPEGHLKLREAFFQPQVIKESGGLDPLFRGIGTQVEQDFDTKVIDDLRNFLFGAPGQGGLDLAAMNIQRGRERGLADYNTLREEFGLSRKYSFDELSSNPEIVRLFEETYGTIDNIDPWVGFLAEDHMAYSLFGETVMEIVSTQFLNLRDGDRFYYENDASLNADEIAIIEESSLSNIVMRNTGVELMQDNVFLARPMVVATQDWASLDSELSIYPNPSTGQFRIDLNTLSVEDAKVTITAIDGRKVYQTNTNGSDDYLLVDLSNQELEAGIYLVTVQTNSGISSEKIIIK